MKTVQLAITLATDQRDQQLGLVVQARQASQFAQDQMLQLESYAADTEARWSALARVRANAELMRHNHHFMARLHQAMGLQRQTVAALKDELRVAGKRLLAAELRLASLKQVLQKRQGAASKLLARREQKQMDEFAALQHRNVRSGHYHGDLA